MEKELMGWQKKKLLKKQLTNIVLIFFFFLVCQLKSLTNDTRAFFSPIFFSFWTTVFCPYAQDTPFV